MKRTDPPTPAARPRAAGFTLLELIGVIGIIAILTSVVVGGFNGIIRALSRDNGPAAVRRALNLARQQACVDGKDVFLFVTGLDTCAVVRKSGTVSSWNDGSQDFTWGKKPNEKTLSDLGKGRARWVFDDYADLASSAAAFQIPDDYGEDEVRAVFDQYRGLLAFDMDDGTQANVIIPPQFNQAADAYIFGVDKTEAGSSFKTGHDYGWLVFPEQRLPKGYVFHGVVNADDGTFDRSKKQFVHYLPDGTVATGSAATIPVLEVATGTVVTLDTATGKVTVSKD